MANHKMNVTSVRYSEATKVNALKLLAKGWTISEVAKKHKTTVQSIHTWKKKYPNIKTKVVLTKLGNNNGEVTAKSVKTKKSKKKANTVTITLPEQMIKELNRQAKEDLRTLDAQIKFYVLNGIRNHHGIPF
tara:strand:- start:2930 stop:3325 length:396 start_codon:yes stop_codon:yes gene_type:complete